MKKKKAKKIIFAYACCGVGKCEICPLARREREINCEGFGMDEVREAVETVAGERERR